MAMQTILIQGETLDVVAGGGDPSLQRTTSANAEQTGAQTAVVDGVTVQTFDEFGLRPNYIDAGYFDINGNAGLKAQTTLPSDFPAEAGSYDVYVRVANGSVGNAAGNQRVLTVGIDGVSASTGSTQTGQFYLWGVRKVTLDLPAVAEGTERVLTFSTLASNGPNIDAVAIVEAGTPFSFLPPEFTSPASFSAEENSLAVGTVEARDLDGEALSFAIAEGGDGALFSINPATGALSFREAPDFETDPASYALTVTATDGALTTTQAVTVNLLDLPETPPAPQPAIVQQTYQAEDAAIPAGAETFHRDQQGTIDAPALEREGEPGALKDGVALDKYALRAGYSGTGYTDFGGTGTDETITWTMNVEEAGLYDLHVRYASTANPSDLRPLDVIVGGATQKAAEPFPGTGFQNWVTKTITVELAAGDNAVTLAIPAGFSNGPNVDAVALTSVGAAAAFAPWQDGAPAFTGAAPVAIAVDEGASGVIGDFAAADADPGDAVTYGLSGDDAGAFTIDANGQLSLAAAPDFEAPADADGDGAYAVTVTATAGGLSTSRDVTVTVGNVNEAPTLSGALADASVPAAGGAVDLSALVAADPDGTAPALGVRLAGGAPAPAGVAVVDGALVIPAGLPAGALALEIFATDGALESAPISLAVNVEAGAPEPIAIAFDLAALQSYGNNQDRPGDFGAGASVGADGGSLTLDGNLWKRLPFDRAIEAGDRLELTISTTGAPAEIIAVGLDPDNNPDNGKAFLFQLAGTQSWASATDLRGRGEGGTFSIDLTPLAGQQVSWLNFIADDDNRFNGTGTVTFSEVRIVPSGAGENQAPRVVGGGVADLAVDEGGAVEIDLPFTDPDGDALAFGFTVRDASGADVTAGFGLSLSEGVLSGSIAAGVAPGLYTVTATAADPSGAVASDDFKLEVRDVNEAPVVADAAFEPLFGKVGEAIAPIDIFQFTGVFSDPDGQELTYSVEDLPAGLSLNDAGAIVGTPTEAGAGYFTLVATDPGGLSAEIRIELRLDAIAPGDVFSIEAEDFTGLAGATGFFATGQAGASGGQIIRSPGAGTPSAIETDLSANGVPAGWYTVAIDVYDETDGAARFSLSVGGTVLADGLTFDAPGEWLNGDGVSGRGNAGQAGNLKRLSFEAPVYVDGDAVLRLTGQANGELLRTDRVLLTRVEAPNQAPSAPVLDASIVAENAAGAVIGTLSATDPDGTAVTFSVADPDSPFTVENGQLRLKDGVALDFEAGASVSVEVTATDGAGASTAATLVVNVTDVDEAPSAPALSAASVAENVAGAVVGTLSAADPEGAAVTFSVDPASDFEIVGGQLKLKDGVALNFEAAETVSVDVTASDGTNATTATLTIDVIDGNDAPILPAGAALADVTVEGGTRASIDLSVLGATDEGVVGPPLAYVARGANGATLPAGFTVNDGTLIVAADAPAGAYEVEVFATDGELDSESVFFTVTVGAPAPFAPIVIQAEGMTLLPDADADPSNDNLVRTRTQNQERDGLNNPDDPAVPARSAQEIADGAFDEYGIRSGYTGTGYLDINGTDTGAQAQISFTAPAGTYAISLRVANGSTNARPITLDVDGVRATIADTKTPQWWQWETRTVEVTLETGGTHVLTIEQDAGAGAPNIDAIAIHLPGTAPEFAPDTTADEGGDLAAAPALASVEAGALSAVAFQLSGVDADVVLVEASLDGGATFAPVVPVAGAVTLDLSGFAGAESASVTFRVTDDAGNTATTLASVSIGQAPVDLDPIVIQAEDASLVTVTDVPGANAAAVTREVNAGAPDAFGNYRPGAEGGAYIDFGTDPGDAISFAVDAPVAGEYEVTFRYANGGDADRPLALAVNGGAPVQVSFPVTTAAAGGQAWETWREVTLKVTLAAGANAVSLAIPAGAANGPNIDRATFTPPAEDGGGASEPGARETIRINFQDGSAPKAEGYLVANFDGYQDRGGISYGWVTEASATDADGTTNTPINPALYPAIAINERTGTGADGSIDEARDFSSYDPRLTGYAHFDLGSYPGAQDDPNGRVAFEVGVENGWYEVTVAVGDTGGPNDSDNRLLIEGQLASSFVPTNRYKTELVTSVVKVEDGHLTLSAPDGNITEVQYLEIRELPDLTPGDGREAPADYARFVNPVAVSVVDGQQFETDLDPASGPVEGVDPTADITIGVSVAEGRSGVLLESLTDGSIRVFETLTGAEVAFGANTTGGFDSLTISPTGGLKPFTSYTIVIDGFRDRGDVDDLSAPTREFQKFSTTFVTKAAPVVEAREVAFVETLEATEFTLTSLEVSPDGQHLYAAGLGGVIKRWDIDPSDGSLSNEQTLALSHFQEPGVGPRGIIGLVFDPTDPKTLWVTDNYPVPLEGRDDGVPDFSGRVSKITLGDGPALTGTAEAYITGLPRSNGDHVTNSLEFRANPDADGPSHLLYVIQGSNSAMGAADGAWGLRPERLLNAAVMEIDPTRDAPPGGFNVATEPLPADGLNRRFADPDGDLKNGPIPMGGGRFLVFAENGTATVQDAAGAVLESYYDPFAPDAVLKLFATGTRNAYDLVWHSNGFLYAPTNGSAAGGNAPNDPDTPVFEGATNIERQDDYLFVVSKGTYSGHPNPLRDEFVLNGGNPTAGQDPNQVNKYPVGIQPDADYDPSRAYSLGPNRSPNGAIEYTSDVFGASLKGAVLFTEYSSGNDLRAILVDPVTGLPVPGGDFVLRDPSGNVISHPDPLDVVQGADGRLYLLTLNRSTGESLLIRLDPAPGGEVADTTADAGGDLALTVVDASDPAAVVIQVTGLDDDIVSTQVSIGGAAPVTVTLDAQGRFTADLSGRSGPVSVALTVRDDATNVATATASITPGAGGGDGAIFIDAAAFTVLSAQTGANATLIRLIDVPSTHETGSNTDADGDGLNDGYDGRGYLDPNGTAEDKASFTVTVAEGGTYEIALRMANGNATQARPIALKIDGETVATIADTKTGSFDAWQDFTVSVRLEAGANTVVIAQTGNGAPNIDSVRVTPAALDDTTADVGGDLALSVLDASDPSAVVFSVAGLDADIVSLDVSFDGGATSRAVTLTNGTFTADLSGLSGAVTAELTVRDGANNVATADIGLSLGGAGVPNDGTETVGGVAFVRYEAESAQLSGDPAIVSEDRTQSGDFVDFLGPDSESVTWTVEVAADGAYAVDILYALGEGKAARPMALSVDGAPAGTLTFAANSNAAESVWGPQSVQLQLTAGVHTIAVTAPGGVGPNVDYLRISQAPVGAEVDDTADEGGDLALALIDASDPAALVFEVSGLDDDIETVTLSLNGGPAVTVTPDAQGQFTADGGGIFGPVTAALTVADDARNTASVTAQVTIPNPAGNPNAEIEVQSLDAAFLDNRLHFSWIDNPSNDEGDRDMKGEATVRLSNPGTEPLEVLSHTLTGPFDLKDPAQLDGLVIQPGGSVDVTVVFDRSEFGPARPDGQNGTFSGALTLVTNDADSPVANVDLAGFWQPVDEGGREPNVNEVWEVFGFGNRIEGLKLTGGGENSVLNFFDLYIPVDETEVLSPYFRLADGVSQAKITQLAAFHGPGGASLAIHNPANKAQTALGMNHQGTDNQRLLPDGNGEGGSMSRTFGNAQIPDAWQGDDAFGITVAGLSTNPNFNPTGNGTPTQADMVGRYAGYTVTNGQVFDPQGNPVPDGYTVRMFQAVDADGDVIAGTYLGVMDYTGINYDYNDNMFVIEGVEAIGFGQNLAVSGLDAAAADDRLVFSRIDAPKPGQSVRDVATFTIENDGFGPLKIAGLSLTGADAGSFEIVSGPAAGAVIAAGQSATVTVRYVGTDPANDNAAVLHKAALEIRSDDFSGGVKTVALAGLAQIESEGGEEPTVAQIVEAFGYSTDVAQSELAGGGAVETVGDEVLLPYFEALDGAKPVEVIQLAAYLSFGNVNRLNLHGLGGDDLTELYAASGQAAQSLLPAGLGGGQARATFSPTGPFGLKVTVDGRPTFAAWTDPNANDADPAFNGLSTGEGHYIRFFEAKGADGAVIPGTYIGVQDYPGGENFDYNDHMFLIRNVKAHALTAAEDANGDGVLDALQLDADGDGVVNFFDDTPGTGGQPIAKGGYVVGFNVGGPAVTSQQGLGGVALRADTDPLIAYAGDGATRAPGQDVGSLNGANALPGAFKTYRDGTSWSAEVKGLTDGEYVVVLHTQETYWNVAGKRVFDMSINGVKVADDLDPFVAGGGGDKPVAIEALVQVVGGKFTVSLDSLGADGIDNAALNAITVYQSAAKPGGGLAPVGPVQAPFPGPDAPDLAGGSLTVDASNYDQGGQGVSYNDAPGLQGGTNGGRAGSSVEQTSGGDIGWIAAGEWLEYTVDLGAGGVFDLDLLLATSGGGRSVKVDFFRPGEATPYATAGSIANPSTGSYTAFAPRSADGITLEGGEQVVRVTFGGGSQDFRSFTLTQQSVPTNTAPVATDLADATVNEGAAVSIDVKGAFTDPGDTLTYSATGLPAGLSINAATGIISGTAPLVSANAAQSVIVTAMDAGGLTASVDFTLTVADVPPPASVQAPFGGTAPLIGDAAVTVDATNFDEGGQGVAWNDDPGRDGGNAFRGDTDVELVGAENDIGYVEAGEWVEYTVNVAEAGTYALSLNAKTPIGGNAITVSLGGGAALATFALPDSNGAETGFGGTVFAETPVQEVALEAGLQTLRFAFSGAPAPNGYLLDFRSFTLDRVEAAPPPPPPAPDPIGEAGIASASESNTNAWTSVSFSQALDNPVVVMGPASMNDGAPVTIRVQNVTSTGFQFQLDEWDYQNGVHGTETVSWLAIEAGTHELAGGRTITAGIGSATGAAGRLDFGMSFDDAPVVLTQVVTKVQAQAVAPRVYGVDESGFVVELDRQEADVVPHGPEGLAWIALEEGGSPASGMLVSTTGNLVTHQPFEIDFGGSFGPGPFAFLAGMQTRDSIDTANLRLLALDGDSARIFVDEEGSRDRETNHADEDVGFVGLGVGSIFGQDPLA